MSLLSYTHTHTHTTLVSLVIWKKVQYSLCLGVQQLLGEISGSSRHFVNYRRIKLGGFFSIEAENTIFLTLSGLKANITTCYRKAASHCGTFNGRKVAMSLVLALKKRRSNVAETGETGSRMAVTAVWQWEIWTDHLTYISRPTNKNNAEFFFYFWHWFMM